MSHEDLSFLQKADMCMKLHEEVDTLTHNGKRQTSSSADTYVSKTKSQIRRYGHLTYN